MSLPPFGLDAASLTATVAAANAAKNTGGAKSAAEVPVFDTKTGAPQSSGGATSLFSAFYVFKYSGGVDVIDEKVYSSNNQSSRNGAAPKVISNPTASAIVEWAKTIPANQANNQYGIKNSPYSWSDFLFCKWYGIVPNNRLVTLRKFPLGTEDDAGVRRKTPVQNIPIAQAVTWFGAGTGNDLNQMWQSTWSLAWVKKDITPKEVQGNQFVNFSQALVKALTTKGANPFLIQAIENLAAQADMAAGKGGYESIAGAAIEAKEQEYLKSLWSDNGAFFNQIQGPVNVKNTFLIRDRGLSAAAPDANWKIIFEYKTDSYFGMSQKRVALDIIANMLALTYSDGEWKESLNVHYKKLGLALAPSEQLLIESAFKGGTLNPEALVKAFTDIASSRADTIISKASQLAAAGTKATVNVVKDTVGSLLSGKELKVDLYKGLSAGEAGTLKTALNVEITKALAESFPGFVQQRANVAGTPTGNWHLTIGNPMNPIMRIGDIVVRSCQLEFGDELGPDDFPIDLKFIVTLSPTKPRDNADIRQTFNLGRTDYVEKFNGHTFDEVNTYGLENKNFELASKGNGGDNGAPKPTTDRLTQVSTWLNNRYGAGMGNTEYLTDVYFYVPKEAGTMGGSN